MPESAHALAEGGRGWSREEVDEIGCLRMLRDPAHWHTISEDEEPDADARKKAQIASENASEDAFLAALGGSAAQKAQLAKQPSYMDYKGTVYNHDGEVVPKPKDMSKWETDELLPLRCPHPPTCCKMATLIRLVKSEKDSSARLAPSCDPTLMAALYASAHEPSAPDAHPEAHRSLPSAAPVGGTVACVCRDVPPALGEPVFDRLEAKLAHAMLSLPATKGFEFGSGFGGTVLRGSVHNDPFKSVTDAAGGAAIGHAKNHAGGTLGAHRRGRGGQNPPPLARRILARCCRIRRVCSLLLAWTPHCHHTHRRAPSLAL